MSVADIEVGFLFLGGAHQALHAAPAAAELSCDRRLRVTCFVASDAERDVVAAVFEAWPEARLHVEHLPAPHWARWIARLVPSLATLKLPRLLYSRRRLTMPVALVTTERTSTVLRRFHLVQTHLLHIPHGAGDRARGFEPRLRYFDYVMVSGPKDAARMISAGLVAPENCAVAGSIKMAAVARLRRDSGKLFANGRPIVLYNPHFSRDLGSWLPWGRRILAEFAARQEFNLIFAPHVRLFEHCSAAEREELQSLAVPGRIIVDPGSEYSHDMTYLDAADIYLGDVSSQVYEFLARPRPCVFLNTSGAAWRDNPDYACWRFGEVVDAWQDVMPAVQRAAARHPEFAALQKEGVAAALGDDWLHAPARAAGLIRDFLAREEPALRGRFHSPTAGTAVRDTAAV